jgi:hypothetical protein
MEGFWLHEAEGRGESYAYIGHLGVLDGEQVGGGSAFLAGYVFLALDGLGAWDATGEG